NAVYIALNRIAAQSDPMAVDHRDAAPLVSKHSIVLDKSIVDVQIKDDSVKQVILRDVILDGRVVRSNHDEAVLHIVMKIIVFDVRVVGITIDVQSIRRIVIDLIIQKMHSLAAKRVGPAEAVMNAAVGYVTEHVNFRIKVRGRYIDLPRKAI